MSQIYFILSFANIMFDSGVLGKFLYSKGWFTICNGDVTDRDEQLPIVFTIRVHPVPIITILVLHDYVILVLCFPDWVTVPNHFLLKSTSDEPDKIESILSVCQCSSPSTNPSVVRLEWYL